MFLKQDSNSTNDSYLSKLNIEIYISFSRLSQIHSSNSRVDDIRKKLSKQNK